MTTLQLNQPLTGASAPTHLRQRFLSTSTALQLAETAYAADADHLARQLLIGLILEERVDPEQVGETIERGLARFKERSRAARLPHALR